MASHPSSRKREQVLSFDAARAAAERLSRFRAGDTDAFDEILAQYWAPIVRYVERFLNDRDLAQDVAQEVFIRLWLKRHKCARPAAIGAFLYSAAHNLAIDEKRKEKTRKHGVVMRHAREDARTPPTPAGELEQTELRDALERAVEALPARRREVFILYHLHDLSYRQIAEVMGIKPQVVANYMSAALAELRQRLRSAGLSWPGRL